MLVLDSSDTIYVKARTYSLETDCGNGVWHHGSGMTKISFYDSNYCCISVYVAREVFIHSIH